MRINASDLASILESDLASCGFNGSEELYPGCSERQAALIHLKKNLLKKYLAGTSDSNPSADEKALEKFMQINDSCKSYDPGIISTLPDWVRIALGEAKAFLWDFFYPVGPSRASWDGSDFILTRPEIERGLNVGPGSSIGSPNTDFFSKFGLSDMSASTSLLHKYYVQAISHNPTWAAVEALRSAKMGYGIAESSRLSFVPKYSDISRTICTEPLLNMMFQKGIASVLERRLRQVLGIDLRTQQTKNAMLARIGSQNGNFGTIDLTSASDSMSRALVSEFFPADAVRWLDRTRCKSTILPDGRCLELHMISSMGNAFTFPLQTIFFAALVYGAYRAMDIPIQNPRGPSHGNFAVFGDDIIVVSKAYNLVCEMLSATGFCVNMGKSFNEGFFRESCGHDYYCGYNVRAVYIKRLRDECDCYSAINRLNRWSARHGFMLPRLVSFLKKRCRWLPIPFDEDDSHGVKVPYSMLNRKIYNPNTGGILYRYKEIIPNLVRVDVPEGNRPRLRGWFENPPALLMAFVAGSIRDGSVGLRISCRRARIRRRWSSRWDFIPVDNYESNCFSRNWKVFTEFNLLMD